MGRGDGRQHRARDHLGGACRGGARRPSRASTANMSETKGVTGQRPRIPNVNRQCDTGVRQRVVSFGGSVSRWRGPVDPVPGRRMHLGQSRPAVTPCISSATRAILMRNRLLTTPSHPIMLRRIQINPYVRIVHKRRADHLQGRVPSFRVNPKHRPRGLHLHECPPFPHQRTGSGVAGDSRCMRLWTSKQFQRVVGVRFG